MEIGYIYINRIKTCLHHSTSTIIKVPICSNPRTNSSNLAVQQKRAPFEKGEGKPGPSALLNSSVEAHFHDDDHHHHQQHYHTLSYIIIHYPPTHPTLFGVSCRDGQQKEAHHASVLSIPPSNMRSQAPHWPRSGIYLGARWRIIWGCGMHMQQIISNRYLQNLQKVVWSSKSTSTGHIRTSIPNQRRFPWFPMVCPFRNKDLHPQHTPTRTHRKKNAKNDGTVKYCKYAYVWRCLGGLSHPSISPRNVEKTRKNNIKQDELSDNPTNIFLV